MKNISFIVLLLLVISCSKKSENLKYADVDTSSNEVLHLTDKEDYYYSFEEMISKNKGNLIYVEFWSSSSLYAMDLMRPLEKLEKDFEGKEFIIVSINVDLIMMPFEKHLSITTLKNNYLARNFPKASFFEDHNFEGLPRFMLFDKNGKIIDSNAMAPDNENLAETLKVLLKNQ